MPDPDLARMRYWLPFIEKNLKADSNSIIIGHSTGAVACMRYLASHQPLGACYTDWIIQYTSQGDPYIPIAESRYIHHKLNCEYHEYTSQGHFAADVGKTEFPELVSAVLSRL